jgi:two-component system KDP operon response regulator KdpE
VSVAHTGGEGLSRAAQWPPDLVVLDLGLPDLDGVEVCKRLRQWTDVPVIVLSALDSEDRKVLALDSGADDYVTKPFGMPELEARLRVALRHSAARNPASTVSELTVGPIHLDVAARAVDVGGDPVELTAREFDLLAFLARNAGKVCTHRTILREVWGPGYGNETHYLRVYASRLRHKLGEKAGPLLRTNPGVGYQLVDEAPFRPSQLPGGGGTCPGPGHGGGVEEAGSSGAGGSGVPGHDGGADPEGGGALGGPPGGGVHPEEG